jgi:hypothetical protein
VLPLLLLPPLVYIRARLCAVAVMMNVCTELFYL